MYHAYAYALGTAILVAVTLSPVISCFVLSKNLRESYNPVWESIRAFYHWLFVRIISWPRLTLAIILLIVAGALSLFPYLGGEFLPHLEEGNIWARATLPLSTSLDYSAHVAERARQVFLSFPEGRQVVPQTGRPDDGTDPTEVFHA